MLTAGRAWVESKFSRQAHVSRMAALYDELTAKGARRPALAAAQ